MNSSLTRMQTAWLLAALALSLGLGGCSSSKPKQPEAQPAAAATEAKAQSAAEEAKAQQEQAAKQAEQARAAESAKTEQATKAAEAERAMHPQPGDTVEVHKAWVQVRNQPSTDGKAIALVFGNDTYTVVEEQGDWLHVKLDGNREGWIPREAVQRQ